MIIKTQEDIEKIKDKKVIKEDLSIRCEADLGKLEEVDGYLWIHAKTELRELETVGKYLWVHKKADLRELKKVGGSLGIYKKTDLRKLEKVGGDLEIRAKTDLRKLEKVGENLWIHDGAEVTFNNLNQVAGKIDIHPNAILHLGKKARQYLVARAL